MLIRIIKTKKMIQMDNSQGIFVDILVAGASVCRIGSLDRGGKRSNIVMTLRDPKCYDNDPSYTGATLGPVSGRIPKGLLAINGKLYQLTQNEGPHHLHGGFQSVSRRDWQILGFEEQSDYVSVCLGTELADRHEGYPGYRQLSVTYRLFKQNCLDIIYTGQSDAHTYFNLSNHCYWNLSGDFAKSALTHILRINAQSVWLNNGEHIPVECCPVRGTAYDFTEPRRIDRAMSGDGEVLVKGYNNLYCLNDTTAAILEEPVSGRRVIIETDYPALQFYSGGYLDGRTVLEKGVAASAGCALAFEPQEAPVLCARPAVVTPPTVIWTRTIRYTFDNIGGVR